MYIFVKRTLFGKVRLPKKDGTLNRGNIEVYKGEETKI